MLREVVGYLADHPPVMVDRHFRGRDLRYEVIDGEIISKSLPRVWETYLNLGLRMRTMSRHGGLEPMANLAASVNVNITGPGGEYRWHYDRNLITAILFLTPCEGGELEAFPNYRIGLGHEHLDRLVASRVARTAFSARKQVVVPKPGRLVVMQADVCLHSVRPVTGGERICLVMAYDPPAHTAPNTDLDRYLFTNADVRGDPNYRVPSH